MTNGMPILNEKKMFFSSQNGTVVIENPDMLKASAKYSNGHTASPATAAKTRLYLKGPTDKQIEARTSDGRRRITPIFIPPPAIENGATVSVHHQVLQTRSYFLVFRGINILDYNRSCTVDVQKRNVRLDKPNKILFGYR